MGRVKEKDSRRDKQTSVVPVRMRLIETVRGVERDRLREKRGRLSEGVEERKAGVWGRSRDSEKEMQRS